MTTILLLIIGAIGGGLFGIVIGVMIADSYWQRKVDERVQQRIAADLYYVKNGTVKGDDKHE